MFIINVHSRSRVPCALNVATLPSIKKIKKESGRKKEAGVLLMLATETNICFLIPRDQILAQPLGFFFSSILMLSPCATHGQMALC